MSWRDRPRREERMSDRLAISSAACCQEAAVCRLTAANRVLAPAATSSADSSHGVGGVCSVVSIGMVSVGAIATGRWCRLWL